MAKVEQVHVSSALAGNGSQVAQVELLIGPRGSAVEAAFCSRCATNPDASASLVVSLAPNLPCKPHTLMVNSNAILSTRQTVLFYGPVQSAVARAVTEATLEGTIDPSQADDLFMIVSVFIHSDAHGDRLVYQHNFQAMKNALRQAIEHTSGIQTLHDQIKHMPGNPYQ